MHDDLTAARIHLESGNYTCVLCNGSTLLTDKRRGIRPLLNLLEQQPTWQGYCAADKVVGKAAAYLYQLMQIDALYAQIISEPAVRVLKNCGIRLEYGVIVPAIRSRDGTGFCPMETAVWDIEDASEALDTVKKTLEQLK